MTILQSASRIAPSLFEEGIARTIQEAIPTFAVNPHMAGDMVLARLYSTERGDLTASLLGEQDLRLKRARAMRAGVAKW